MSVVASRQRRPRTVRDQERRVRPTERDLWVLEALAKMRFLTTTQLARLHFEDSRWSANKRLRKLLDAGMVRVWVRDLAKENIYSLDRAGAKALVGAGQTEETWTVPRTLDGNLEHVLAINDVRISLARGLAEAGGELAWWRSDWELRAQRSDRLIPDALFALRWEEGEEQVFVLEVDTERRSAQTLLKKILRYTTRARRGLYGAHDFLILVVGREPEWVERYRLTVAHTKTTPTVWFTTLGAIEEKRACGPIWKGVLGDDSYSLRDLKSLPYGKEVEDSASPCFDEGTSY